MACQRLWRDWTWRRSATIEVMADDSRKAQEIVWGLSLSVNDTFHVKEWKILGRHSIGGLG